MSQPELIGKQIKSAVSSLTTFSCEFTDGTGLIVKAMDAAQPWISGQLVQASALPKEADAVCKVDWSWIIGSSIMSAKVSEKDAQLQLDKVGLLRITLQMW